MKILFVAMHISVHTARWLAQLRGTGWDVYLFPVHFDNPHPHHDIQGITLFRNARFRNVPVDDTVTIANIEEYLPFTYNILERFHLIRRNYSYWLAKIIDVLEPDIVHAMEMQHSAYLTYEARKYCKKKFPRWIYSCWGSDIYYYQQFEDHCEKIRNVLKASDYLFTDTMRDVDLAKKYCFAGELLGVFPGVGGYKIDEMRALATFIKPSERKSIVIKGYTGWVYRPYTIFSALEECVEELKGYTIALYLPVGDEIVNRARELSCRIGTELRVLNYGPHEDVLKLFASARISLASSISDGTPNSMLESMVMGAFPIQSDTVSTGEWIENGVNGFLAGAEDVTAYVNAIKIALIDDDLVDRSAEENYVMLKNRIDYSVVHPQVISAYEKVYRSTQR